MNAPEPTSPPETSRASLARDWLHAARYYLGRWPLIVSLSTAAVVAGIALNWNWVVAMGLAPILISVLPCAVMCALGLCFHRLFTAQGGQSLSAVSSDRVADLAAQSTPPPPPAPTCCSEQEEPPTSSRRATPSLDNPTANERRDNNA